MASISAEYMTLLEKHLNDEFVPHLPPLLDTTKPAEQLTKKNLSRAFAGYAIAKLCGITPKEAAESVVDDFGDFGIDAIYYLKSDEFSCVFLRFLPFDDGRQPTAQ